MPEDRGDRLKQALVMRQRTKLYAFAVELGVNPSSVTRWIRGGFMSIEHAVQICDILSISLDWLLTGRGGIDPARDIALSEIENRIIGRCRTLPPEFVAAVDAMLGTASQVLIDAPR